MGLRQLGRRQWGVGGNGALEAMQAGRRGAAQSGVQRKDFPFLL